MAKLKNYLRTLIRKWLDKMQYKIEHEMDEPVKIDWDKLIDNDIWKKK